MTPDSFTLLFEEYIASVGPDIPIKENRKNCNLLLKLDFPPGWSFAISGVDHRGFCSLDKNVTLTQRIAYFLEGGFPSTALQFTITGPFEGNCEFPVPPALVWSPCGVRRALNINMEARVNNRANRGGSGLMTGDTFTGVLSHTYGIKWRRC